MMKIGSKEQKKVTVKPNSASSSPSRSWIVSDSNPSVLYNGDDYYNSYKYNIEVPVSNMPILGKLKIFYQLAIAIFLVILFLVSSIYLFYNYNKNNYSYNFLNTNMDSITANISLLSNLEKDLLNKDINQFNNLKETINELSGNIATLYTIKELNKDVLSKFESDFNITKNKVNYINNSQNFLINSKTSLLNINNFLTKFYLDMSTSMEQSIIENNLSKNDLIILNKIMSSIYIIKSDISLLLNNNSDFKLLVSIKKNNELMKKQFSLLNQMSNSETKKRMIYYYNIYLNTIEKYISDINFKLSNFNNTLNSFGNLKDNNFSYILTEFNNTLLKINKYENIYLYSFFISFLFFLLSILLIIIINKYEDKKKYELLKNDYDVFDKDLNKIVEDLIIISQKDMTHKISLNGNVKLLTLVDSINQTLNNVREKFDSEISNLQGVSNFITNLPDKNIEIKEILVKQKSIFKENEIRFLSFNKDYPTIKSKIDDVKDNLFLNEKGLFELKLLNQSINKGLNIVLNKDNELNERLLKMQNSINEATPLLKEVLKLVEKIDIYTLNSKIQAEKNKGTIKNISLMNEKVSNAVRELTTKTQKIQFFINNLNSDMDKTSADLTETMLENKESNELFKTLFKQYTTVLEKNNNVNTNFKDIYKYISQLEYYMEDINKFKENIDNNQLTLINMLDNNKIKIEQNKKSIIGILFNLKTYTNKNSGD